MSYVILNDIKSTLIQGLLIQSLPPISKPLMRTTTEEIDGRDGDIVTKLGYSAYDKQMSIGLFGDYDVDEVIQYFASEGTVIFSNEPDKFYRYQIIDQIDFEKLIRFKTATVTFHVQPFKFSAIDDAFGVTKNQMSMKIYSSSMYGVDVSVENNIISLSGTATRTIEFYVPLNPMALDAKQYTLNVSADGTGLSGCQMRVIGSVPTDADSFGGTIIQIDESVTLTDTLSEAKIFNYIWITIAQGTEVDFEMSAQMLDDAWNSFNVFNRGNAISRPTLTIYGAGTIKLSINNVELFTISLGEFGYITLDGLEMNAYKGDVLMNRYVAGDYANLILNQGKNILSWTGNVTKMDVENVSRWI